jgi:hypothetical protein
MRGTTLNTPLTTRNHPWRILLAMEWLDTRPLPIQPATGTDAADEELLSAALRHLLTRDDDRPARWRTPGFAAAVEDHRSRVRQGTHSTPGDAGPSVTAGVLTYETAVARLASEPATVAIAIAALERASGRRLGPWRTLLRPRSAATPSSLDIAIWFG